MCPTRRPEYDKELELGQKATARLQELFSTAQSASSKKKGGNT
jgi:hypothetical protein